METFTNYIKVRVGLCFTTASPTEMYTDAFLDKLYAVEEQIRSSIILQLNEAIGLHNWAIMFVQLTPHSKNYFADIWVNSYDDYARVFYIIRDQLNDHNLTPFYKGTVEQLLTKELIHQEK